MIKARLNETNTGCISLFIRGHARAAEVGQDIICASASILAYTVAQLVKDYSKLGMLNKKPTLIIKKGNATVTCIPKKKYYDEVKHSFYVVQTGLNLLAHNYPQYITLEMFGQVEKP